MLCRPSPRSSLALPQHPTSTARSVRSSSRSISNSHLERGTPGVTQGAPGSPVEYGGNGYAWPVEVTPILNVSDLDASFEWFTKLGLTKRWEWCPPEATKATFGGVGSEGHWIHLCLDGQGGRGEHGAWLTLWVDDVDAIHAICQREAFQIVEPPEDKPWGLREMHVRHPDGHVLRFSAEVAHDHSND